MLKEKSSTRFYLSLVLLVILSSMIRLFHYPGQMTFDEQRWIFSAKSLLGLPIPELHPVYFSRVLWNILLAGWGYLFNWSWGSLEFLLLILSAGTIIAIGFAARIFFDSRAGILGSIFFALHPINIIYDMAVLPDTLAVFLTAVSLVFFGYYLRTFRIRDLVFAGFLAGLLFSVKSYYVLYVIPFSLVVILFRAGKQRTHEFSVLSIAALGGLTLAFLLAFFSGHGLAVFQDYSDYAERLGVAKAVYPSLRQWINLFLGRIQFYLNAIFNEYSQIFGLLSLWTIAVLAWEARRPQQAFLLITLVFFLFFLMFMPVSFHPLMFVEFQTRYITIMLVPLSIGAGYALDLLASALQSRRLAVPGLVVFTVALGIAAAEPNLHWDRYQLLLISGVRKAVELGKQMHINTIALPEELKLVMSKSLLSDNIEVIPLPFREIDGAGALGFLEGNPAKHALFIPREPYRMLVDKLRVGNLPTHEVDPALEKVVSALEKAGVERAAIFVPFTSLKARLADLGIETQGQLVGWLYSLPTASEVSDRSHDNLGETANSNHDKDVN